MTPLAKSLIALLPKYLEYKPEIKHKDGNTTTTYTKDYWVSYGKSQALEEITNILQRVELDDKEALKHYMDALHRSDKLVTDLDCVKAITTNATVRVSDEKTTM